MTDDDMLSVVRDQIFYRGNGLRFLLQHLGFTKGEEEAWFKEHGNSLPFDFSDVRIIFDEKMVQTAKDGTPVGAACWDDHIELYPLGLWFEEARTPEHMAYLLNHESVHASIRRILDDENLNEQAKFRHWPIVHGMDECSGWAWKGPCAFDP